jgi:hypothetical protein
MSVYIEPNDRNELVIPLDRVKKLKRSARYKVDASGDVITVTPARVRRSARSRREAEEWVKSFLEWANEPKPPVPHLPDEAFRRENLYD